MVGLLFFLAMQICYVRGFVGLGALTVLRRRLWIVVAYAVVWAALCAWLLPALGALRWPMLGCSVVLAGVAALAAGVSRRTGLGGLLFFVSDSLIAVGAADRDFAGRDVMVMATYALAQYLIASGWLTRARLPGSSAT